MDIYNDLKAHGGSISGALFISIFIVIGMTCTHSRTRLLPGFVIYMIDVFGFLFFVD